MVNFFVHVNDSTIYATGLINVTMIAVSDSIAPQNHANLRSHYGGLWAVVVIINQFVISYSKRVMVYK